jgi:acyl-CoA thioesterase
MTINIPADISLADLQKFFANDRYACVLSGTQIVAARPGHVVCEMELSEKHLNAMDAVMGGAIFTLADFALAVISNLGEAPTVSVSSTIEFLNVARGKTLIATAKTEKSGKSLGFYTVNVTDELGTHVAHFVSTCYRKGQ